MRYPAENPQRLGCAAYRTRTKGRYAVRFTESISELLKTKQRRLVKRFSRKQYTTPAVAKDFLSDTPN
jgi:hypothetical protein